MNLIETKSHVASAVVATMIGFVVACGTDEAGPGEESSNGSTAVVVEPATRVVTTMNIVADWVANVGGERVDVFSIVPVGSDPHSHQPGARDVTKIADADLVVAIGLSLEDAWLDELVRNAGDESTVVELGDAADPLETLGADEGGGENDDNPLDPHFWLDPLRVKGVVSDIAARLSALDIDGGETYRANAQLYNQQLDELNTWIEEQVATIPGDRRVLVTSHENLRYFAERYGFEVVGTVVQGTTTEREPSAQEMARLVDAIREQRVPAIFVEASVSDRLAQRIADEAGVHVESGLYTGSLGEPGSGAGSYIEMMKTDVAIIVEALR